MPISKLYEIHYAVLLLLFNLILFESEQMEDCSCFRFSSVALNSSPYENGMSTIHTHTHWRTHASDMITNLLRSYYLKKIWRILCKNSSTSQYGVLNGIIWLCWWYSGICIGESNLNLPNCILEEPDWPGFQGKNCEFHRFLIAKIINESLFAVRLI